MQSTSTRDWIQFSLFPWMIKIGFNYKENQIHVSGQKEEYNPLRAFKSINFVLKQRLIKYYYSSFFMQTTTVAAF